MSLVKLRVFVAPLVIVLFGDFARLQHGSSLLPRAEHLVQPGGALVLPYIDFQADFSIHLADLEPVVILQGKQGVHEPHIGVYVREHSDTKLIIVDTLQKVREMVSDNYSYSSDYEVIGKLKQFADQHGVCILIVHHTRKQPAGDSFEKISGTTGLSGCADGELIMQKEKRTDGKVHWKLVDGISRISGCI